MENMEAQRVCGQCHKEVAESNFMLHEMHCKRFLCVCPDCEEAVPREQLEQHREEQHAQVRCSKCNKKMERCHLSDHESDECVERLQTCHFCDLELPWRELEEHCLACGSRTELCRECGRYITLRDQREHALTCSSTDQVSSHPGTTSKLVRASVSCARCKKSFSTEDIDKHKRVCAPAAAKSDDGEENKTKAAGDIFTQIGPPLRLSSIYKATSLLDRGGGASRLDGPNSISTCPHCHLALPLFTLRWHEPKCQRHRLRK